MSTVTLLQARSKGILPVQCAAKEGRAGHLRLLLDHGYNHCTLHTMDVRVTKVS